jgi:hypothetical protein
VPETALQARKTGASELVPRIFAAAASPVEQELMMQNRDSTPKRGRMKKLFFIKTSTQ